MMFLKKNANVLRTNLLDFGEDPTSFMDHFDHFLGFFIKRSVIIRHFATYLFILSNLKNTEYLVKLKGILAT